MEDHSQCYMWHIRSDEPAEEANTSQKERLLHVQLNVFLLLIT